MSAGNLDELANRLFEIGDEKTREGGIPEIRELLDELMAQEKAGAPAQTSRSRSHTSWWGNYHEVSDRQDEMPLCLVVPHQDSLDVIVSSLNFPHNLGNLGLSQIASRALVIDEATMTDLRLGELASAISQTRTQAGYRMLEYALHFPARDPAEIRNRQEMFQELAYDSHLMGGLRTHFEVMADNEAGFVEFVFPLKTSPALRKDTFLKDTFLQARKYLAEISAVAAKLKTARSQQLVDISNNLDWILKNGTVKELYDTIVNHESIPISQLKPETWAHSLNRATVEELAAYTPILAALEHGQINYDFGDERFKISPRSPSDPVMLNWPIRSLELNLNNVREAYFPRNLIFNLYYTAALVEALCSLGGLPGKLPKTNFSFPTFKEAAEYAVDLRGAADPYLLAKGVKVVPNDYKFDDQTRGYIITGPNSGGKTVFGFTLAKLQVLAQIGLPVPADSVQMTIADRIRTIRPTAHEDVGEGRYLHLLRRTKGVIETITSKSLVSVDDFEGTDPEDSRLQSLVILEALLKVGAGITMTTQDRLVVTEMQQDQTGAYKRIIPIKLDWEENPDGGIIYTYKAVPGTGGSIGGVIANSMGMDRASLQILLENRRFR